MRYSKLIAGLTLAASTSFANAGLVIDSINVKMVNTQFSARNLAGNDDADRFATALADFNSIKGPICDQNLDALEGVSYRGTCGGTRNDYGALYTIKGSLTGTAEFEFGLDWGLGGFIGADFDGAPVDYINDDIWWSNSWSNGDVLSYSFADVGNFTLTLLGFEGCCDGTNSARYRTSVSSPMVRIAANRDQTTQAEDSFGNWQTLEVNAVPVPGSLPLMAVGALLLLRRRQQK
jgi:hypothetical protein